MDSSSSLSCSNWPVVCPTHGLSIDELCIAYCGANTLSRRGMVGGEIPSQAPLGVLHETPRRDEISITTGKVTP